MPYRSWNSTSELARLANNSADDALRPLGLTNGQFSLLTALNRPQPVKMGAIAALLAMDRTTLTAALKPLQRANLVAVAVDPVDRRGRLPSLTRAGSSLLAAAVPVWRRTHAEIERRLAGADRERLRLHLRALAS
jgi:DNA-binding MarR family transcriptional regulator